MIVCDHECLEELDGRCYGGWGLVFRQLGECFRVLEASTKEQLSVCRTRNLIWKQAIKARGN